MDRQRRGEGQLLGLLATAGGVGRTYNYMGRSCPEDKVDGCG